MNENATEPETTMPDDGPTYSGMSASYSAEDNKLRLYSISRLSNATYARVKAAGFRWAPKQDLFVAPSWSPAREDLLLELAGEIDDEDYSPEERAADRAERFSGYRDKRRGEAGGLADRFDSGPSAFGHQNRARAERQARRHDRYRTGAVSQWSKAEYWQTRTEGVISHALYKSSATVRRSRILTLEAELRKVVANYTPTDDPPRIIEDEGVKKVWVGPKGRGGYWARLDGLEERKEAAARWVAHYENRLAYERAMLAAEGGTAADADMEPGGWIRGGRVRSCLEDAAGGWMQIQSVNRSPVTGRVVSVKVWGTTTGFTRESGYTSRETRPKLVTANVERMPEGSYRAPTDEEREAFKVATAERKKAAKATAPKVPPLVNPTDADAQKLQDLWNAKAKERHEKAGCYRQFEPTEVKRFTQAQYSARSQVGHGGYETVEVMTDGRRKPNWSDYGAKHLPVAFKVRKTYSGNGGYIIAADAVIVLTDKPQKPLPLDWENLDNVATPAAVGLDDGVRTTELETGTLYHCGPGS